MKLEAIARETDLSLKTVYVSSGDTLEVETTESLLQVIALKKQRVAIPEIAYAAQRHLGTALSEVACRIADDVAAKQLLSNRSRWSKTSEIYAGLHCMLRINVSVAAENPAIRQGFPHKLSI